MNSTWLITSELANQRARKVLFTCVLYTNYIYIYISSKCLLKFVCAGGFLQTKLSLAEMAISLEPKDFLLIPRCRAPFDHYQESQPLGRSFFLSMCRVIDSYNEPIGFDILDSERAQSDWKSVNGGLLVLALFRDCDSWC